MELGEGKQVGNEVGNQVAWETQMSGLATW